MLDLNNSIKLQWSNGNKSIYQKLGFQFTKNGDTFDVPVKMLPKSSKIRVFPICDYCGSEYNTEYCVYKRGHDIFPKDACSHCAGKKTSEVSFIKRANRAIDLAQNLCEINGYILLSNASEYESMRKSYVRFLCPIHGEQKMLFMNFISGHKCIVCSYELRGENLKHSTKELKEYIESVNDNKLLNPEEYVDAHTNNLKILCGCGKHTFTTSYSLYRVQNRCSYCTRFMSNMEKSISEFLTEIGVEFQFQKTFNDCKDIKELPFDFYIPSIKLIIEFDGKHHYFAVYDEESLQKTQLHDQIKNKYCNDNNINILRIPYYRAKDFKLLISNKINEISKRNSLILQETVSKDKNLGAV